MTNAEKTKMLRFLVCSFCHKTRAKCKALIQAPDGIHICDECVGVCAALLRELHDSQEVEQPPTTNAVDPVEGRVAPRERATDPLYPEALPVSEDKDGST